jgi:hypothetical protein
MYRRFEMTNANSNFVNNPLEARSCSRCERKTPDELLVSVRRRRGGKDVVCTFCIEEMKRELELQLAFFAGNGFIEGVEDGVVRWRR